MTNPANEESEQQRVVMPEFMGKPRKATICSGINSGKELHEYGIPDGAENIIVALQWMVTVYDDVDIDYGEEYGCPFAHMYGYVKEA
tara:strand:+ start:512 stop:772 length:261 start_codon:yes stop_codon:yes gene_type:complete